LVKRRISFNDDFNDFDDLFKGFFGDDAFKDMFAQLKGAEPGKPLVYGLRVTRGPDGKVHKSEFGNLDREGVREERAPLTEIIDCEGEVKAIMELPGVERRHLRIKVEGESLAISVDDPVHRFATTVKLPAKVKADSCKATLKNGILEVVLPKVKPSKPKGSEIKVD